MYNVKDILRKCYEAFVYLMVFVAFQVIVAMGMQLLWRWITGSEDQTAAMLISASSAVSILTIIVFVAAAWAPVSPAWLRSRQWSVLAWSVVAAMGTIVPSAWLQEMMPELPDFAGQQLGMILGSRWGYVAVGLLAPVAEEMVFRGAILRTLLTIGRANGEAAENGGARFGGRPLAAVVTSSVLFALVHANPVQMPHAFLIGLLLGWMYWRTGSILPAVAFHWANNSVAYILYNVYPSADDLKLTDIFSGGQQHVLMAVAFSMLILLPALWQLHLLMRPAGKQQNA